MIARITIPVDGNAVDAVFIADTEGMCLPNSVLLMLAILTVMYVFTCF